MNAAELALHKIAAELAMRSHSSMGLIFPQIFFVRGASAQPKKVCWFLG
jgi:hypothetical protein